MYGIDLLVKEHENVIVFTDILIKICCNIIDGKDVDVKTLHECVDFARNYADKQHHGKEEKILFRIMLESQGVLVEKLIRNGMLVEHDLGRYHITELVKALDSYEKEPSTRRKLAIIANAVGYADLLKRHIEKEDAVCYSFAMRMLSETDKRKVDLEIQQFESESNEQGIQDNYLNWLQTKTVELLV